MTTVTDVDLEVMYEEAAQALIVIQPPHKKILIRDAIDKYRDDSNGCISQYPVLADFYREVDDIVAVRQTAVDYYNGGKL